MSEVINRIQDIMAVCILLFLNLPKIEMTGGKVLEETYHKWVQYKESCIRMIQNEPALQGLFCNRTFDLYACWPDTPAGSFVNITCPFYLPWYDRVYQGVVRQHCNANGLWQREDNGQVWRDMTQCEEEEEVATQDMWFKQVMVSFKMLYTVGYSLSLSALIIALIILLSLRKLHCTRNYIHANLFLSLILRAVSVIVKDAMLEHHWGREIMKQTDVKEMLSHQAAIGCRIAQVMMQYCVLANHCWFFGEAIYLNSVLIASVLINNNRCLPYICLGWGTPLLFVVPWVVMKLLKENKECWAVNENMYYWWIIRLPILLISLIDFLIFLKILKVIISKLRANNQSGYPDYKLRLAKATLTLIPLFGLHEIIFIFAADEQMTDVLLYVKVFLGIFISSFQGLLVAVLYCYANKEVREELRRKLQSWRTDADSSCFGQWLAALESRVETFSIATVPGRNRSAGTVTRDMAGRSPNPDISQIFTHQVQQNYPQCDDSLLNFPSVVNRVNTLQHGSQSDIEQSAAMQVSFVIHLQDPVELLPNVVNVDSD
ncbi:glucagon receptor-like isoform X2 [Antennarius striatus]|uniref:glucagon receptor-like isoform X2 n=1 Tax=Antennarius striatus TaxID=241820 RepID=UPI0035B17244